MRNYQQEITSRAAFIRQTLEASGTSGIVYGNSGGKDCSLVGILCKMACDNTVGIAMPCHSTQNYEGDMTDALALSAQFGIETRVFDLTATRASLLAAIGSQPAPTALINIAPRLRMTALYAVANSENRLVAGTGNASERHMGYFTKWGDGAFDFNPIADLRVEEVFDFLRYLGVPESIVTKPPSAGLYPGQTDEEEMGVTYAAVDAHLRGEAVSDEEEAIIRRYHAYAGHKTRMPLAYGIEGINSTT